MVKNWFYFWKKKDFNKYYMKFYKNLKKCIRTFEIDLLFRRISEDKMNVLNLTGEVKNTLFASGS